jgi:hypothetical protein
MTDTRQFDAPVSETPGATQAVKEEAAQVASTAVDQGRQTAAAAADVVGQTAGTAAEGAKQVASEAAQQVTEVTRQATEQARDLVGQAQAQLHEQASTQAQRAAGGLADVGKQIRALGEGQPDRAGFAADAAKQLADKVEGLAGRLEERGFDGTVADLRNFARRRPGAFLLGAAATGFVVGRLGKGAQAAQDSSPSSSSSSSSSSSDGSSPALPVPVGTQALQAPETPLLPPAAPLIEPEPYLPPSALPELDGGV